MLLVGFYLASISTWLGFYCHLLLVHACLSAFDVDRDLFQRKSGKILFEKIPVHMWMWPH